MYLQELVCVKCKNSRFLKEVQSNLPGFRKFECSNGKLCRPFYVQIKLLVPDKKEYVKGFKNTKYDEKCQY